MPTGNCRAACSPSADVAKHQGIAAHVEGAPLTSQRLGQALRRRPRPEAGGWRPAAGVVAAAAAASASLRSRAARLSPRLPSWRWSSWPALSCHARLHAWRGEEWGRGAGQGSRAPARQGRARGRSARSERGGQWGQPPDLEPARCTLGHPADIRGTGSSCVGRQPAAVGAAAGAAAGGAPDTEDTFRMQRGRAEPLSSISAFAASLM